MADIFGIPVSTIIYVIIIAAIALALERLVSRYISHFARRVKLEPSAGNNLVLTFRILILIFTVLAISSLGGVGAEWLLSVSAIGGAAIGFASQKTIGNFVAGIFLLAAHPFKVGNYVRIGAVEGIVSEITINYTKILTPNNNMVSVSNLQILDRDITNFLVESTKNQSLYCYSFEIGFDHSVSNEKISEIFSRVFEKNAPNLPKKPTYCFSRSTSLDRIYLVYLYVKQPEDIFKFKPQISEEVFEMWDVERLKNRNVPAQQT